jgi:hypothetical protein
LRVNTTFPPSETCSWRAHGPNETDALATKPENPHRTLADHCVTASASPRPG